MGFLRFEVWNKPGVWGKRLPYRERDVERLAWKKYGGPENFERLYVNPTSPFPQSFSPEHSSFSLSEKFHHHTSEKPFQFPTAYLGVLLRDPEFQAWILAGRRDKMRRRCATWEEPRTYIAPWEHYTDPSQMDEKKKSWYEEMAARYFSCCDCCCC